MNMDMSMTMSMPDSSATPTTGVSMPTSTDSSASGMMMMGMNQMTMTFFTSSTTALFSSSWTPASTGQYAGTCIFLIVFAVFFRALLAARLNIVEVMAEIKRRRSGRYAVESKSSTRRSWRADEAVVLASMDVVLAGVGYLLMIAVMTMNVGYFLSILAGVFLGSMIFGRFMAYSVAH